MRLIAYVRVSTAGQLDGYGLGSQRHHIAAWAAANGHTIAATFEDAISGTTAIHDRPGLVGALQQLADADGFVVARLDRLARQLTTQEAALALLWAKGVRVFAADHGEVLADDPSDPMRTAMRQMVGVFAQLDRAMVVKRLADGRERKRESGEGRHTGQRAYEEGDDVAAVVARMRALRADGRSLRDIADTLNAEGITAKQGGQWHGRTVGRVLARCAA